MGEHIATADSRGQAVSKLQKKAEVFYERQEHSKSEQIN